MIKRVTKHPPKPRSRNEAKHLPSKVINRRDTVRIPADVARRVRDGHPLIYRDALQGRQLSDQHTLAYTVIDPDGSFVARAALDPGENVALRVFSKREDANLDMDHLCAVIARAAKWRRTLMPPTTATEPDNRCFRVLSGDTEGIPATNVDRYGPFLLITSFSPLANSFAPLLIGALENEWHPRGIYWQTRHRHIGPIAHQPGGGTEDAARERPGSRLVAGVAAPQDLIVEEASQRYIVDVSAPASPGFFPDMRIGRQAVAKLSPGKRVLNCFSYSGGFSLVAACAGATEVVSIDSSERAHARARRNFSENGLDPADSRFEFVTGDVFSQLCRYAAHGREFDCVIVDPPTFSKAKTKSTRGKPFTALKNYADLVEAALKVVSTQGILFAASNAARLPRDDFERAIGRGAAQARTEVAIVERLGQPGDYPSRPGFPEGRYLKIAIAVKF